MLFPARPDPFGLNIAGRLSGEFIPVGSPFQPRITAWNIPPSSSCGLSPRSRTTTG